MGLISDGTTIFDAGAMSAGFGGSMVFIKKLTASSSGTLSFVNGASGVVLDNTYKEYLFTFKNMHPSANGPYFQVNFRDGGTNYDAPKTTAFFAARHKEDDSASAVAYITGNDLAEGTGAQFLDGFGINNDANSCVSGMLQLFNPSSTTFVKHFLVTTSGHAPASHNFTSGYCNTTTAIDGVQFTFQSGNIDAGDICLYGIA
mgnify:FL=1|tara:strand:- start:19 stop:624 length:606 start_codon:yes stop_codon:yes gene_type:complete